MRIAVQTISDAHLLPVIEQMLAQLPFEIPGFHADNGSVHPERGRRRGLGHHHSAIGAQGRLRPTYSINAFSFEGCSCLLG